MADRGRAVGGAGPSGDDSRCSPLLIPPSAPGFVCSAPGWSLLMFSMEEAEEEERVAVSCAGGGDGDAAVGSESCW